MLSQSSFEPPWWLKGPHAQTIGSRVLRPKKTVDLNRQRWTTPDGDFLDIDFVDESGLRNDVLVLVLHGLEGSSESGYAYQLYHQLARRGIRAAGLNFRSCSGELNRGLRLYHSGETSDTAWVVERLREQRPERQLAAIGISLGGNVLLKFLGEQGHDSSLVAASAWSAPFDLRAGAKHMESGFARTYVTRLVHKLQRKLRARADEFDGLVDVDRALRATTFWEFDDAATAPLHGFAGADDYYERSSSRHFLSSITTPTLVLHSKDDPFQPAAAIPLVTIDKNPAITGIIADRGGHVGMMTGSTPFKPYFWAENTIADWIEDKV